MEGKQAEYVARQQRRRQRALKARVGPIEEDGSFRVRGGRVYDPDTTKVRRVAPPKPSVSPDVNGPHRGMGGPSPQLKKPTYSTKPGNRKKFQATREHAARLQAAARLEKAGLHDEARQLRAGQSLSRGFGERLGGDLQTMAFGLPGGLYQIGKAATLDTSDIVHGRVGRRKGRIPFSRLAHIGKEIGETYAHNYRHPLRYAEQHPGFVLTDLAAALSAGAGSATRVGAAGSALRETGSVRAALGRASSEGGSLLKRPLPEARTHYYQGQKVPGRYSINPASKAVQKANDRRALAREKARIAAGKGRSRFSSKPNTQRISTIGTHKAARLGDEKRRVLDAAERSSALRLLGEDRKMRHVRPTTHGPQRVLTREGVGKNLAVDVVGVGLPIDEHVRLLRQLAGEAEGSTRKQLSRRAELIDKEARKHLDESSGKPRMIDTELERHVREALGKNEEATISAGLLSRGGAEARTHYAGRALLGAKFEPKSLAEMGGADFHLIGKRVRTRDGMRGAIVETHGDTATIRLWRKGNHHVEVPLEELYPASGKVKAGRLVGGGRAIKVERQATVEEAKTDLAALNERIDKLTKPIIERDYQEHLDMYQLEAKGRRGAKKGTKEVPKHVELPRYKHGGQLNVQKMNELREYTPEAEAAANRLGPAAASARDIAAQRFWNSVYKSKDAHALRLQEMVRQAGALKDAIEAHEAPGFMQTRSPLAEVYTQRFGNVVDVDHVRELIPAYASASLEEKAGLAAKYHEPASAAAKELWREMLEDEPKSGVAAIMAGGSGAGKTQIRMARESSADAVLDATLSNIKSARARIEEILATGREAHIDYVYRDPGEAYLSVLERAKTEGRVVPMSVHVEQHIGANETIRQLLKDYKDDDRVQIRLIDSDTRRDMSLGELPKLRQNEVERSVHGAYQEALATGQVTEAVAEAALSHAGAGKAGARAASAGNGRGAQAGALGDEGAAGLEFPLLGSREELVGSVPYTGGEFYTSEHLAGKKVGGPQAYRGGVPRKPGSKTNPYTGALRRAGANTHEVLKAIAEHILTDQRYLSVERLRQDVLPMGEKARPVDTKRIKWVPVRERPLTPAEAAQLRDALQHVDDAHLTPDQAATLDAAIEQFTENLFPIRRYKTELPGAEIPGVKWVDSRLIGSQHKLIGSLGPVDVVQDAVKGLILYAKPGYVTPNVLGNAAMNVIQQGFLAPANWKRATSLDTDLGFMVDEVMGAGFSRGLAEGTSSVLSGAVHKAGNFWSKFVDGPFRRAAFIHEARRYGFRNPEGWKRLIEDPENRGLLAEVGQRARDAIVDYERLGPAERDVIRRVIFVYPWIKGSTYYAGQFLRDHPIQAAVFAGIAQQGERQNTRDIGPVPAWARGSFKVFEKGGHPYVVNPSAITPFSTPVQFANALRGGGERSESIGEMFAPTIQSGLESAFGRDFFTGEELPTKSRLGLPGEIYAENFLRQLGKGLPQTTLYRRGGLNSVPGLPEQHAKEGAAYPYGQLSAIGQFVLGSSSPRPINRETLNEQALPPLDPAGRARARVSKEARELHDLFQKVEPDELDNGKLPKGLRRAFGRRSVVEVARARIEHDVKGSGGEASEQETRLKFDAEVDILAKWGIMDAKEATAAKAWQKRHSVDDVKDARRYFTDHYFDDAYLGLIRDSRKYLEGATK